MIPIIFKSEVRIRIFSPAIHWILNQLYIMTEEHLTGLPEEIVITSINDSKHPSRPPTYTPSKHYSDKAIDIRSKNFESEARKEQFRKLLELRLNEHPLDPGKFRAIYEFPKLANQHFHVQVKKGGTFLGIL